MPRHSILIALTAALVASVSLPAQPTGVQPHRLLPGRRQPAGRHRPDIRHLGRNHRRQRRRQHAGLFRQPAHGDRLHRHHRREGAEGRRLRHVRRRADLGRHRRRQGARRRQHRRRATPSRRATSPAVDLASKTIEATCDLGGQPDSIAARARTRRFAAIAIENERDEDVNDGEHPADAGRRPGDRAAQGRRRRLRRASSMSS